MAHRASVAGGALLALGGAGLEERVGSQFAPVAFRGPLLASLVVALVQIGLLAQLALFHAIPRAIVLVSGETRLHSYDWHPHRAVFELACAAADRARRARGSIACACRGLVLHLATGLGFGVLGALQQTRVAGVILLPLEQTYSLGGVASSEAAAIVLAMLQVTLTLPLIVAIARSSRSMKLSTR